MFLATNLRRYFSLLEPRGIGAESMLHGTGISLEQLQDDTFLVSREQCLTAVNNMIRQTGEAGL